MKTKIKKLFRKIKKLFRIRMTILKIRRFFGYYPYFIQHEGDGCYDYLVEVLKEEKPFLLEVLNKLRKKGIVPMVGDALSGYDILY